MSRKKIIFMSLFPVLALSMAIGAAKSDFLSAKLANNSTDEFVGAVSANTDTDISLDKLKVKIKEKGLKWEAGETSISMLSSEEKAKRVAGSDLKLTSNTTPLVSAPVAATAASFDWRNNNGNYVTPIKDQGSCGSCWAFATTATAESVNLLKNNTTYNQSPIDLSEQVMLSCSGAGTCNGGYPTEASNFLLNTGLPSELCYAYSATNGACANACANWQASASKINNYVSIAADVTSIKNALVSYGPISTVFSVYSDFYYYNSGVYSYAYGTLAGGHAVTIVGYDDATQSFLVKNSWGSAWGEAGYFRIAYSEVGGTTQFGRSNLAYNTLVADNVAPTVSIASPASGANVAGVATVSMNASDNVGVTKVELYANGNLVATDSTAPYSVALNTASLSNGNATLVAYAYDAYGNKGISASVTIVVSNVSDTVAPIINIVSPFNGANVGGTVIFTANASDNVKVTNLEAYIDNTRVINTTSGAFSYSWNTKRATQGTHTLTVKARDAAGNLSTKVISVNVSNGRR